MITLRALTGIDTVNFAPFVRALLDLAKPRITPESGSVFASRVP